MDNLPDKGGSKGKTFKTLFLILCFVNVVVTGPTGNRNPHNSCATQCVAKNDLAKFRYDPGTIYTYDFQSVVEASVLDDSSQRSKLRIEASVEIQALTSCDFSIELKRAIVTDPNGSINSEHTESVKSALEKSPLRFAFQDGHIQHICPHPEEVGWVLNVKRGILSMLQNTMESWDFEGIVHETDISGKCDTKYTSSSGQSWAESQIFQRSKDLTTCTGRRHHLSTVQSVPYVSTPDTNLLSGNVQCTQTIREGLLEKAECREEQVFKPFDQNSSGAKNVIVQTLRMTATTASTSKLPSVEYFGKRVPLTFEPDDITSETTSDCGDALKILQDIKKEGGEGGEEGGPFAFRELVETLRSLDEQTLRSLMTKVGGKEEEGVLMNALPLVNTAPSMSLMTSLYLKGQILPNAVQSWLSSVTFIKHPSPEIVDALLPLLRTQPSTDVLLSVSALLHSYCKVIEDCESDPRIMNAIDLISGPLQESCIIPNDGEESQILNAVVILKALGNLGVSRKNSILETCFRNKDNTLEVRLAAIDAYRRVSCSSYSTSPFLKIYSDYSEQTEARIQAYLIAMRCVNRKVFETVEDVLNNEVVNQVGSFVWTHLTNLQETKRADKEVIRALLSNEILQNKFQTDARKFSRNYESSMFSDDYKMGAGIDSNIIFTEGSFLPKSGMVNLSMQLFGETVNLLEVGGRFSSLESLLEPIFGPEGYFPDDSLNTFLKSSRHKRETSPNKIARLGTIQTAAVVDEKPPGGSMFARVFGHEVLYKTFDVDTNSMIPKVMDERGQKWFSVKNILDNLSTGKKTEFKKSTIILDVAYSVPTISGLPLSLTMQAGSVVGLTAEGRFNLGRFMETRELELYGLLRPNLEVGVDASLTVQLGPKNRLIRSGLAVRNVLRSSTAIESHVEIDGMKEVKASLNLPQKRQDILDLSSKVLFVTPSGKRQPFSSNLEIPKIQYSHCVGDDDSGLFGLKFCGEISVPEHFTVTPQNPALLKLFVEKMDDFSGYTLDYNLDTRPSRTQMSVVFDTPGSKIKRQSEFRFQKSSVGTFQSSLVLPSKRIEATGAYRPHLKQLEILFKDGKEKLLQLNATLSSTETKLNPYFYLLIWNKPIIEVKGLIQLPVVEGNSRRATVDLSIHHVTQSPIKLQGNYNGTDDGSAVSLALESYFLTGNLRSQIKSRPNHLSSRSLIEYALKQGDVETLDVSAKLQRLQKGTLYKINTGVSLITSKYPDHGIEFSWETQTSPGFCENTAKLVIGKSSWDGHTLYSIQNTRDLTEVRVLFALNNPREDVDYHLEFFHRMVQNSLITRFLGRMDPKNEVKASVHYDALSKPFMNNNISAEVTWPGHEYSVHTSLKEKQAGEFDAELLINLNNVRQMKATLMYINKSNNLKLDHLVEFRARGFFSIPVYGNIAFSVTDKQSHLGSQIFLEGKLPYSSKISTSLDYSNVQNRHKIEAKVALNEKKYSSEIIYAHTKSGSRHLTVDLFLNQHVFMEAKVSDLSLEGVTGFLNFVPNKGDFPQDKLQLDVEVDSSRMDVKLEYFGSGYSLSGSLTDDTLAAGVMWRRAECETSCEGTMTLLATFPAIAPAKSHLAVHATSPFIGYESMSLEWKHEFEESKVSGKLIGHIGSKSLVDLRKSLSIKFSGDASKENGVELLGEMDVSGYSRCGFHAVFNKSTTRDLLKTSVIKGDNKYSFNIDHVRNRESRSIIIELQGLEVFPEVNISWNHNQGETPSAKLDMNWGYAGIDKNNIVLEYEQHPITKSCNVSLTTPWPTLRSLSNYLRFDRLNGIYAVDFRSKTSISIIPRIAAAEIMHSGSKLRISGLIEVLNEKIQVGIDGQFRGIENSHTSGFLYTNESTYNFVLRNVLENGIITLEMTTNVDNEKSEFGFIVKNGEEEGKKEITAWGAYLSGPEKKATLLLENNNQMRKISLSITDGVKRIFELDMDLLWAGYQFWNLSYQMNSQLLLIPSVSIGSTHNMLDTSKITNSLTISVSPTRKSFWETNNVLPVKKFSVETVISDLENLFSKIQIDDEEISVSGKVTAQDLQFDVHSSSYPPLRGQAKYALTGEKTSFITLIALKDETILDVNLDFAKSADRISYKGALESTILPHMDSMLVYEKSQGKIVAFLKSNEDVIFNVAAEARVSPLEGLLSLNSTSSYYSLLNNVATSVSYKTEEQQLEGLVKYSDDNVQYNIQGMTNWGFEPSVRIKCEGDFKAEFGMSLQNMNKLLAHASYNGVKLGEIQASYEKLSSNYVWGKHLVVLNVANGKGVESRLTFVASIDPKKFRTEITTPFPTWNKIGMFWELEMQNLLKFVRFGVHKDSDKLDAQFDIKTFKRNETTIVGSEINVSGFKAIRTLLLSPGNNTSLTLVDGQFSATAKWSTSKIELVMKTPMKRWRSMRFTGNYENKRGLKNFAITCDVNERHHEFSGSLKSAKNSIEAEFQVQCLQAYKGTLTLNYAGENKFGLILEGPSQLWRAHGTWTDTTISIDGKTPLKGYESMSLEGTYIWASDSDHQGRLKWSTNGDQKEVGYIYKYQKDSITVKIVTPIRDWEKLDLHLTVDEDQNNIGIKAERKDGQKIVVDIQKRIIGDIRNLSMDSSMNLTLSLKSSFEQFKKVNFLTQYFRKQGEHVANVEYSRNDEVLTLNGHFFYNPNHPHSMDIQVDLLSFQHLSSKVQASLSIDLSGNSSFSAVVEINEIKHEVNAALDLSNNGRIFSLLTTLPFLKTLYFAFKKADNVELHGKWEGNEKVLDLQTNVLSKSWTNQRLNLSITSPFEGLRHVFLFADYRLTKESVVSSVVFENEEARWLGKLDGTIDGLNGSWNAQCNTPIPGYHEVSVQLKHSWKVKEKVLAFTVFGNRNKALDFAASLREGELQIKLDSEIAQQDVNIHSVARWGTIPLTIETILGFTVEGRKVNLEINVRGMTSGMVNFRSADSPGWESNVAWKLDGSLEDGNAWVSLKNAAIGSRSLRTLWKINGWRNLKTEWWLRVNDDPNELGATIQFQTTRQNDGKEKARLLSNWITSSGANNFTAGMTLGHLEGNYIGSLDIDSSLPAIGSFHATSRISLSPNCSIQMSVVHNNVDLAKLNSAFMITFPKGSLTLDIDAPKILGILKADISYNASPETKIVKMSFQQNNQSAAFYTSVQLPASLQEVQLEFVFNSNITPVEIAVNGNLNGSYSLDDTGTSKASLSLTSDTVGGWTIAAAVRPTSDFILDIKVQNHTAIPKTIPSFLLQAYWNGNIVQGIGSKLMLQIGDVTWINGSFSMTQSTLRLNLISPFGWMEKGLDVNGSFNWLDDEQELQLNVQTGGEVHQVSATASISKGKEGFGTISISKGSLEQPLGSLSLHSEIDGNFVLKGQWDQDELAIQGSFRSLENTSLIESGLLNVNLNLNGKQLLSIDSSHKFKHPTYSLNITSGDREFRVNVIRLPHFIVSTRLQWELSKSLSITGNVKPNKFDVSLSSPWTSDFFLSGVLNQESTRTQVGASVVYNAQKSSLIFQTEHQKDNVQFNASIDIPILHQKIVTSLFVHTPNEYQSAGVLEVNLGGRSFGISGELQRNFIGNGNEALQEQKLTLVISLPTKDSRKVATQLSWKKPQNSLQSLQVNASLTCEQGVTAISFGYDLPVVDKQNPVGFSFRLDNNFKFNLNSEINLLSKTQSFRDVEVTFHHNSNNLVIRWNLNVPTVETLLSATYRLPDGALNNYRILFNGFFDPLRTINATVEAECKENSFKVVWTTEIRKGGVKCEAFLTSSNFLELDHHYMFDFNSPRNGVYDIVLSAVQDDINLRLEGDLEFLSTGIASNGKMSGYLGTLYSRLDYKKRGNDGVHEVVLSLESPSLLSGKKAIVKVEFTPRNKGFDASIQCRTRTSVHIGTVKVLADPIQGDVGFNLTSPNFAPVAFQVSWNRGGPKYTGGVRANYQNTTNELDIFIDIAALEGHARISSPIIPTGQFDVHVKSLLTSGKVDILGDVKIRDYHWRFETTLVFNSWRDMVTMIQLITPHKSFDRLTLALKSAEDEIYGEIYTPIATIPKAMLKIRGFQAIRQKSFHDLHPEVTISLPLGKYAVAVVYKTPTPDNPGKLRLYFESETSPGNAEIYDVGGEISPLSKFGLQMDGYAGASLFVKTPITDFPDVEFSVKGEIKGKSVMHLVAEGKLDSDAVKFIFDYDNGNGSPKISSRLLSPFEMYENLAFSLSFDSFQKIGSGQSLHLVVENPEWLDKIVLNADYRYRYTGVLDMEGEVNAALVSFMDIPPLHISLKTTSDAGFSGVINGQVGATPGRLQVSVQMVEENSGVLINGTIGEDILYNLYVKANLIHQDDNIRVNGELILQDETILSTSFMTSSEDDGFGGNFLLVTPWGPLQSKVTFIPLSPIWNGEINLQDLLSHANATIVISLDEDRLFGLQLVQQKGSSVVELWNPIFPLSVGINIKHLSKSSIHFDTQICWDLNNPVGNTVGIGMSWDHGFMGHRIHLSTKLERVGHFDVWVTHSLSSSSFNQTVMTNWDSPMFNTKGQTGYQLFFSRDSILQNKNYTAYVEVDLPWRSFVLETSSNTDENESQNIAVFKWDAFRDDLKTVSVKWQKGTRTGWKAAEITDYFEINHPLSNTSTTISLDRIYKNDGLQVIDFDLRTSEDPKDTVTFSVFRNTSDWSNFRANMAHDGSNTLAAIEVRTGEDNETFESKLTYMERSGIIRNLTVRMTTADDTAAISVTTESKDFSYEIMNLNAQITEDTISMNHRFLSFGVGAVLQTELPFVEIIVKRGSEERLNFVGGYLNKKKVLFRLTSQDFVGATNYFFLGAELTPSNVFASKLNWQPGWIENAWNMTLLKEFGASITSEIRNTGVVEGVCNEVLGRWKDLSPTVRLGLVTFKDLVVAETIQIYKECEKIVFQAIQLYEDNRFFIKDILNNFLPEFPIREARDLFWKTWNEFSDSFESLKSGIFSGAQYFSDKLANGLEEFMMETFDQMEELFVTVWRDNVKVFSFLTNKIWDMTNLVLEVLEGKIEEIEKKLMTFGLFRTIFQFYKDYATWIDEIPIGEITKKLEAAFNFRIWERVKDFVTPLLDAIRRGVEDEYLKELLETPPLPFIRFGLSSIRNVAVKFWDILEVEQKLKLLVRAASRKVDYVVHRHIPLASLDYDIDLGYVEYNQSLSSVQWEDFTQTPRWKTQEEEMQDLSQVATFWYQVLDALEKLKPVFDLNLRGILPPFGSYAIMGGDYHYFTYDKKYFRFAGECSYLLAAEMSQSNDLFSLIVNYESNEGLVKKKSYTVTSNGSLVEFDVGGFRVTVNGRKVELPLSIGSLFIRRHQTGLELYDKRGYAMQCSLSSSVCTFEVSGWHFGKIMGLLGTYDNEPENDFQNPGRQILSDVSAFAYSWRVGKNSGSCRIKNFAKTDVPIIDVDDVCHNHLRNKSSPLRPCYNTVDSTLFLEMCQYDVSMNINSANRAEAACPAMNAYVTECQKNNVDVWMPPACVRCRLEDGTALTTGENATLQVNGERPPPRSSDNVILLEENSCVPPSILREAIKRLDLALQAEGLVDNRYAMIGFGANNVDHEQPHIKTTSSKVWAHNTLFKIQNDTSFQTSGSKVDLYDAISYAYTLGFRAGVAKNFIAVTCGSELCGDSSQYADVLTLLVENDIKLHLLVPKPFTLKGSRKDELNQIYGIDMNGVYTMKQAKSGTLDPDSALKRQINVPKDFCTPLAMESNGTRFNVDQPTKKVLDVWSRRVAQTSQPSTCQRCECIPDRFGSAKILCHQCVSPTLWKFMEEWKSFQTLDGEEFPPLEFFDHSDFLIT